MGLRRETWIPIAIALVALAVRCAFLVEARGVVFFDHLVVDARAYDAWADEIRAGDPLGRRIGVFYQAPLYPYFLALVQSIVGDDLLRVRIVQAIVGAFTCLITYFAAKRWFDSPAIGIVAAIMLALYPPAIFFDSLIQKAVLDLFLGAVLMWTLACAMRGEGNEPMRWAIVGTSIGLLSLSRESALLLTPVLMIALAIGVSRARRDEISFASPRCSGERCWRCCRLPSAPAVGGEWALTTAQAGTNFYIGNNAASGGIYAPLVPGRSNTPDERVDATRLAEQALNRRLSPAEVSGYWFGRAFQFIRQHPVRWIALTVLKAQLVLNAYEIPDAEDQYFFARTSSVLRWPGAIWHFGVLAPLAAAGIVLTWSMRRTLWPLYVTLATLLAGVVVFYVFARYRAAAIPPLIILAAAAIVNASSLLRRHSVDRGRVFAAATALVVVAVVSNRRLFATNQHLAMSYHNAGTALLDTRELDRAESLLREALRLDPKPETHVGLAKLYAASGRRPDALRELELAVRARPDDAHFNSYYGALLAESGDFPAAESHLRRALQTDPDHATASVNLGVLLWKTGHDRDAATLLRRACAANPDDVRCHLTLARLLMLTTDSTVYDPAGAVAAAQRALASPQTHPQVDRLKTVSAAYAHAGRFDDAIATVRGALDLAWEKNDRRAIDALDALVRTYQARQRPRESP